MYVCEICDRKFNCQKRMKIHIKFKHQKRDKKDISETCEEKFSDYFEFRKHCVTHETEHLECWLC